MPIVESLPIDRISAARQEKPRGSNTESDLRGYSVAEFKWQC